MLRWIAIGTAPGWDDVDKFGQEMRDSSSWRPDPRTTVTTVYALEDGRLLAEGPANHVLADARVREAYLGDGHAGR